MEQTLTAKIRILPSADDRDELIRTMNSYRDACNFISDYCFRTHNLRQKDIHADLYYRIRSGFSLGSQMAESATKTVIARYKTILETQHKWIRAVFSKPQYDLVWNRDYSLTKDLFSVNTLSGRKKVPFCRKGMEKYFDRNVYKFGTAKLVYKHGLFFLHVPVTREIAEPEIRDTSVAVGIDRGINFLAAAYDTNGRSLFFQGRTVKQKRSHYRKLRKELQQVRTPSSRRRLKAIGQRENRFMQDVNHCITKALTERYPKDTLFVLEDLSNVRVATEKVRIKDRYVTVSWAFYDFEQKLRYKAARNRQAVICVPPQYTSQTCPVCGHTDPNNRNKKMHAFRCRKCGYQSNDDRIGGMNLCRMGTEYLAKTKAA